MGKSCVRFKSLDALPIELIGEAVSKVTVDKYVEVYRRHPGARYYEYRHDRDPDMGWRGEVVITK